MSSESNNSDLPADEPPLVEVWLDVGDAIRLGGTVLRVLDTDGDDTMLRLETETSNDDDARWSELPR